MSLTDGFSSFLTYHRLHQLFHIVAASVTAISPTTVGHFLTSFIAEAIYVLQPSALAMHSVGNYSCVMTWRTLRCLVLEIVLLSICVRS